MILSSGEIKAQLMEDAVREVDVSNIVDFESKKKEYAEVGNAVKRMTTTKGWKILEAWMMRHIDVNALLSPDEEVSKKAKEIGRSFAMILGQIQYWVSLGEKAEENKEEVIE